MSRPFLMAFLDFLLCMLVVFIVLMKPPVTQAKTDEAPGAVIVDMWWPAGGDDVDLWVEAPGTVPVGYSNHGNEVCNLLRDDLGTPDQDRNDEVTYCRGAMAGEYVVNVHGYRVFTPQIVKLRVTIKSQPDTSGFAIWEGSLPVSNNEEITAVRFRLDEHGSPVSGSINHLPKPLRHT